jgi:hypothetical protein
MPTITIAAAAAAAVDVVADQQSIKGQIDKYSISSRLLPRRSSFVSQ